MEKCFFALLIFSFFFGCATTQKSKAPVNRDKAEPETQILEDFDPVELKDDDFVVPAKVNDFVAPGKIQTEYPNAVPFANADSGEVKTVRVRGYRIQIGAFKNQEDAETVHREAMLNFENDNVYLIFEPPNYKIRVGDFEARRDAEGLLQKAISMGFKDAWIVKTLVGKEVRK
ncbi:MAG TPA: SPOR domain-containing protein [Bacteroidetes bacterium]|nr:SPOR domain-containing protein [Bacteroidota bacterium]